MAWLWTMDRRLRALVFILLGALAGLGQAPTDLWYVTIAAFAVGFSLMTRLVNPRQVGWSWFYIGVGYFAVALRWIVEPFLVDIATHGWMAPFALALMAGGCAVFWGIAGLVAGHMRGRLALGATLTLVEVLRSLIFSGFPWALAGHIWIGTPLANLAAILGPHGLTLLTFLVAGSFGAAMRNHQVGWVVPACTMVAWPLLMTGPAQDIPADRPLVRIVHPNIPQAEKWDPVLRAQNFDRMLKLSQGQGQADLIVWPESAVTQLMERADLAFQTMADFADGAPIITGVQRRETGQIYHNSFAVLGRGGVVDAVYDKQHLVPFGEYFPGGELASKFGLVGLASSEGGGFTAGSGPSNLEVAGIGTVRPLICYEAIFAEEVRSGDRPDVLVLITNDAWFGKGAGPFQHLEQAQLRSIELGVPMIRAANSGISAIIDGHGRIVASLGLGVAGAVEGRIPATLPATLYSKLGDWPILIVTVLLAIFGALRARRINIDDLRSGT